CRGTPAGPACRPYQGGQRSLRSLWQRGGPGRPGERHRPRARRRRPARRGRPPRGARMIVTVTPNPSLDRTVEIDALVRGGVLRARRASVEAGGKGVNISRALAVNAIPTLAV